MTSAVRAALYLRVSTRDQIVANQERELRQWAERLGLEVVAVYAETVSGARSDRAALAAVLTAAHRREFDVLLVWALDRVSREGIGRMVSYIERLRAQASGCSAIRSRGSIRADPSENSCSLSSRGSPSRSGSGSGSACALAKPALELKAPISAAVRA